MDINFNASISKPIIDTPSGVYDKSQVIDIFCIDKNAQLFYSLDDSFPNKKFWGPIVLRKSANLKVIAIIENEYSEMVSAQIEINKPYAPQYGNIMVIGGAEHCKELHMKIVELVGGAENARIAFDPSSSIDAYASGMDRATRFTELCGLKINMTQVPTLDGKVDFSSLEDESSFWILPIAIIDGESTGKHVEDNPDTMLVNESEMPNIDESKWIGNGFKKNVAIKLRDDNYNIIFLTGGNQMRYIKCLYYPDGTEGPVMSIIREIYEEKGGLITGTSAGSAVLSDIMIAGGSSYGATTNGVIYEEINIANFHDKYNPYVDDFDSRLWMSRGLGLLSNHFISDTHFVARGRIGRLITACLYICDNYNKSVIGIGSDEDAAVIIKPNHSGEVVGATGAILVDVSEAIFEKGTIVHGKYKAQNIKVHYLESGDTFHFDEELGTVVIDSISATKQKVDISNNLPSQYDTEIDVFGRSKFINTMYKCIFNSKNHDDIGMELTDNLEDSYDSMSNNDIMKNGSVLLRFRKNADSEVFKGSSSYHWWGTGDKNYPNLIKETCENRFSIKNGYIDIIPLNVANYPDFSEARNIPLKKSYKKNRSEKDWYYMFDDEKLFRFGMVVIPANETSLEIKTFFFDYAYNDYDRNGKYSPPNLKPANAECGYKDFDIAEICDADSAKIFINGNEIATVDKFGRAVITDLSGEITIKADYKGRVNYQVEINNIQLPLKEAIIKFTEKAF